MRTLEDECLNIIVKNLTNPKIGPRLYLLHGSLKTMLLERIIWQNALSPSTSNYVVSTTFFHNMTKLILPQNSVLTDRFMSVVAASCCKLGAIILVVPLIKTDERLAQLTGKGLSALFANQTELESLKLVWCINFKADVITRIRSDFLRNVDIVGDAVCRCFEYNISLRDKVHLYQRDFAVLAINNPTITRLCLDGVILDINDCYTMLTALRDSLEHLEIKVVRFYAFCQRTHCFYGRDFVPLVEFIDRFCHRLRYLSCFVLQTDFQDRQLRMSSTILTTLCLEGHVFQLPTILPGGIRKLKISINGYETPDHFLFLKNHVTCLEKLYVNFVDDFEIVNELGFLTLFTELGNKLVSLTNIAAVYFRQVSSLLCDHCPNLKELSVVRAPGAGLQFAISSGNQLLPLFHDHSRAEKIRHLHLGLENLCQTLLIAIAENCLQLKTLDLAYCRTLDDVLLRKIAETCSGTLEVLELSLCSGIGDDGILAVAEHCWATLEEIMLFQTKVGDRAVEALASRCPKLKICGIGSDQISEPVSKLLHEKCIYKNI